MSRCQAICDPYIPVRLLCKGDNAVEIGSAWVRLGPPKGGHYECIPVASGFNLILTDTNV